MNKPRTRFCELYRPIGALLLLLAILLLLLRTCNQQAPPAIVPAAPAAPTVAIQATVPAVPTVAVEPARPSVALPKLSMPAAGDFAADGVKLSGTGQPGEMVEVWDGATKVGAVKAGADGTWSLAGKLAEGAHKLAVRTVDAAGKTLNESAAVDVAVPKAIAMPKINLPTAADFAADGVTLRGTGQPGATVEVWDGTTKIGNAVVSADGTWSPAGKLAEGAHKLVVRTVDAAGKTLNEALAVDITVAKAQAPAAGTDLAASGQAYIVKEGDWLTTLAQTFYGDLNLYTLIVDGTNAKAAVDPSFARITNPDRIEPGQKLWIPAKPAGS